MNSEQIFSKKRVLSEPANRQCHTAALVDNRIVTQQQKKMIKAITRGTTRLMPIQRATTINYTTQTISSNPAAPAVTVGREMKAVLDPADQRQGSTPCGSLMHDNLMHTLPQDFIRGHLLNHNLGGPGLWFNMFPISGRANHLHTYCAEEEVKELLIRASQTGDGTKVYYNVEMVPNDPLNFTQNPTTHIKTKYCSRLPNGQFVTPYQRMDFYSHENLPINLNFLLSIIGYGANGAGQRGPGPTHFTVNAFDQVLQGATPVGTITWNGAVPIAYH